MAESRGAASPSNTLRVGDRAVPLAEIEARYIAHRDALNAHADSDATQAEHAAYRLGLSAINDVPVLLAELRRLRAVESAARRYRNHSRTTFACKTGCGDELDAALAAAPPETGG